MPNAFAPGPAHPPVAPLFAGAALLDAEKLDVYRVALEFQAIAGQLVPKRGYAELRDQLDRASIVLSFQVTKCRRTSGESLAHVIEQLAVGKGERAELAALPVESPERVLMQHALSESAGLREAYLVAWRTNGDGGLFKPALFVGLTPGSDPTVVCADLVSKVGAAFGKGSSFDVVPFQKGEGPLDLARQLGVRVYPSGLSYVVRWRVGLAIGISLAILAVWEWLRD
jgi:hypothetical protein